MSQLLRERLLRSYYRMKAGYEVVDLGQEVQIRSKRWGEANVRLRPAADESWLFSFLCSLDGDRPLRELLEPVPEPSREECLKLVAALRREYLLETEFPSSPGSGAAAGDWSSRLFSLTMTAEHWYRSTLAGVHVLVVEAGALGSRVASGLVQLGVGSVTIADDRQVTHEDKRLSPAFAAASPGSPRSAELASYLNRISSISPEPAVIYTKPSDPASLGEAVKAADFAILASDVYSPRLAYEMNRLALQAGTRWTLILADGWDVYVGPTFLPGQTGCYRCLEDTLLSGSGTEGSFGAYREWLLETGKGEERLFTGSPAFADTAAGLLLADLPNLLGVMPQRIEDESSLTLNRQLRIDFRTFDADLEPLIKLPRCECCGQRRPDYIGSEKTEYAGHGAYERV
ncbi:ThiF family adenylyltransferase [Paenibacillus tarimensis]